MQNSMFLSIFIDAIALKKDTVGEERFCGPYHEQMLTLLPSTLKKTIQVAVCKSTIFYMYHLLNHQWWSDHFHLEKVPYGSGRSLESFSEEVWWLSPFKMSVSVSESSGIYTVLLLTKIPHSNLHSVINCHILIAPWTKKKSGPPGKLLLQSVDWLSTFAKSKIFCSSMSFPPVKKLPSPFSLSFGVHLIRDCEPIEITYRAGNCLALEGEKEVFAGPVNCTS